MCFGKKAGLVCPAFCLITFSVEKTSKKTTLTGGFKYMTYKALLVIQHLSNQKIGRAHV